MALTEEEFSKLSNKEKKEYLVWLKGCRGTEDLMYFCREILGYREVGRAHKEFIGRLESGSVRKLLLMPRSSFKSTIGTISYAQWRILRERNLRILIDSEVLSNSEKFMRQIKLHMEKDVAPYYGNVIDRTKPLTAREMTILGRDAFRLKEPSISCAGIGTVNVGMHYDLIICDDLHSEKNVSTKEQIDKVISHYRLLLSLLDPGGEMVIYGTRWHFGDLYGYILEEEAEGWDILVEKAIRGNGTLFFPERLSRKFLDEQKKSQGSWLFNTQYQNEPISDDTATFRKKDFRYWGDEDNAWPLLDGKRIPLNVYTLVDKAMQANVRSDFTGVVVAGVDNKSNIYVLESERHKGSLKELAELVFKLASRYGKANVRSINIETMNFEEVYAFFKDEMGKRNQFYIIQRLVPDTRHSKTDRIKSALQARYENGAVYHKKRMLELEDELLRFPLCTHDDLVDALAYVVQVMLPCGNPRDEIVMEYDPSGFFGATGY